MYENYYKVPLGLMGHVPLFSYTVKLDCGQNKGKKSSNR